MTSGKSRGCGDQIFSFGQTLDDFHLRHLYRHRRGRRPQSRPNPFLGSFRRQGRWKLHLKKVVEEVSPI